MTSENRNEILFSIITPVFNAVDTVARTVESVADQGVSLEHLVLDGGSTDGTKEVLERYQSRFAYFRSAPDAGIAAAFNEGIQHARGRYLLFLNADDALVPRALCAVADLLEGSCDSRPDIVFGNVLILGADGAQFEERARLEPLRDYMSLYHPALFFHRSVFDRIGCYDERYSLAMDSELVHRALAAGCTFAAVDRVLAVMSRGGLSDRLHWRSLREYQRSVVVHGLSSRARSFCYLVRQYLVHEALKVPLVRRWRLARRQS